MEGREKKRRNMIEVFNKMDLISHVLELEGLIFTLESFGIQFLHFSKFKGLIFMIESLRAQLLLPSILRV